MLPCVLPARQDASVHVMLISPSPTHRGTPIPRVDYNAHEIATWGEVFNKLTPLLAKHACQEHVRLLPLLIDNCGYRADNIPQLQDISDFLKGQDGSGMASRHVHGMALHVMSCDAMRDVMFQ